MRTFLLLFVAVALGGAGRPGSGSTSSGTSGSSGSLGTAAGASSASSTAGASTSSSAASSAASSTGSASGTTGSGASTGGAGQVAITAALQLDRAAYAPGGVMHATLTYANIGAAPAVVQRALVTARPPGGSHAGGPHDDFAPASGPATLAPGQALSVDATFALPTSAPTGTWAVFSTYQDGQGTYHDGPSVFVSVAAPGTSSSSGSTGSSGSSGSSSSGSSGGTGYTVVGNTIFDGSGSARPSAARPSLASRRPRRSSRSTRASPSSSS